MKITLPNNWEIKTTLFIAFTISLTCLGLTYLGTIGYDVTVLREVCGFIFLTFVPGVLILRILRIHDLEATKIVLYGIGLSLAFIMLAGFLMHVTLPHLGVHKPFTELSVIVNLAALVTVLGGVAYWREKDFIAKKRARGEWEITSPAPSLFALLIIVLAVLGARLVDIYQDNLLLLVVLAIIAMIPILIVFNRFIREEDYPLLLVAIALALLLQQTLDSEYLTGWDIHFEAYSQNQVISNSVWDSSFANNSNSMLSIVMIGPIYSFVLGIGNISVLKIIYPFFFSLVPLAMYEIFRGQISAKKAFLCVFLFMSVSTFSVEMTQLARQEVAELFFVLFILLLADKSASNRSRAFMATVFVSALSVSHYGLSYIAIALFFMTWLLLIFMQSGTGTNLGREVSNRFRGLQSAPRSSDSAFSTRNWSILNASLLTMFVVTAISWYMYVGSGSALNTVVDVVQNVMDSINNITSFSSRENLVGTAVGTDFASTPTIGQIFRLLQYAIEIFAIIGIITVILRPRRFRFVQEYIVMGIMALLFLLVCIALPYFSAALNMSRIFHITLIVLAPFCVIGAETVCISITKIAKSSLSIFNISLQIRSRGAFSGKSNNVSASSLLFILIMIPYFLFSTGFIFEVTSQEPIDYNIPSTIALSGHRIDGAYHNEREHAGGDWLANTIGSPNDTIKADGYGRLLLWERMFPQVKVLTTEEVLNPSKPYIFLRTWNIDKGVVLLLIKGDQELYEYVNISQSDYLTKAIDDSNKIYDNGDALIRK